MAKQRFRDLAVQDDATIGDTSVRPAALHAAARSHAIQPA